MSSMKCDLSEEREPSNERLVKRIKLEKGPTFKKKSNEKQFHFNEEVQEKLATASASLTTAPLSVEKAEQALKEDVMVKARVPSCSMDLMENWYSHELEDCFGVMPSIPHVPIAEALTIFVQGRLREHSEFWLTELEASDFVKGIV